MASSLSFLLLLFLLLILTAESATTTNLNDAAAMHVLAKSIGADSALNWSPTSDPCTQWPRVQCDPTTGKITSIQIGNIANLSGSLPPSNVLRNLTSLARFEAMSLALSGPIPSFYGPSIRILYLHNNCFSSFADDFFSGLTALLDITLDQNPSLSPWRIPKSLSDCSALVRFSAANASLTGGLSDVFATSFPALEHLSLGSNDLGGEIPASFANNTGLKSLWLNGANLSGGIGVVAEMTELEEVVLNFNSLTGPLPDFSRMVNLRTLRLRDNRLTGPVPASMTGLSSLENVTLSNNLLQGPVPVFGGNVKSLDLDADKERFCHNSSDRCDQRVEVLLSIVGAFGYPVVFAQNWDGNDPCAGWLGISCDGNGGISVVNFQKMNLSGTISPDFESLPSLQKLILSSNSLVGTVPPGLANLKLLKVLDVSNNALSGKIPSFRSDVTVITNGNPDIGKDIGPPPGTGGESSSTPPDGSGGAGVERKKSNAGIIAGCTIAVLVVIGVLGLMGFLYWKKRRDSEFVKIAGPAKIFRPQHSWSDFDLLKNSVNMNWSGTSISNSGGGGTPAKMAIAIEVLQEVTNNFSEDNILGRGGFGTVYRGELHDGSTIAVKRMESGVMESKGLEEFKSEISVLTKVRHRHLVSLLGYCLDRNERILVYEYMPQGTLSDHLFGWVKAGLQPLQWKIRLIIALDVARAVEYLHSLMNQSFIHRDLKPSNILLTNDMRAKVADFGLVRLAPEGKHCSVETRIAGTFGYLAPEYAVTGRVTTKADIYSFGVILLELITGRKALDNSLPEDHSHLVTWFRRMQLNEETRSKAFDPSIDLNDEEIRDSVCKVSELAGHCTARDPHQRPDMSYVVSTLSSLAEHWQPSEQNPDDGIIDINMILPEGLQNLQAINTSQILNYSENENNNSITESSIPPNSNTLTCR